MNSVMGPPLCIIFTLCVIKNVCIDGGRKSSLLKAANYQYHNKHSLLKKKVLHSKNDLSKVDFYGLTAKSRDFGPIHRLKHLIWVLFGMWVMCVGEAAHGGASVDEEPRPGIVVVHPGPEVGREVRVVHVDFH